jgi:hypothetical protein
MESFGMDADHSGVHAEVLVEFRGRRYVYRRSIWPAGISAGSQAAVFATMLEEALHSHHVPADHDPTKPIRL